MSEEPIKPKASKSKAAKTKSAPAIASIYSTEPLIKSTSSSSVKAATAPAQKLTIEETGKGTGKPISQISEASYAGKPTQANSFKSKSRGARYITVMSKFQFSAPQIFINAHYYSGSTGTVNPNNFDLPVNVTDVTGDQFDSSGTYPPLNQASTTSVLNGAAFKLTYYGLGWVYGANQEPDLERDIEVEFASGHTETFKMFLPGYDHSFVKQFGGNSAGSSSIAKFNQHGGCDMPTPQPYSWDDGIRMHFSASQNRGYLKLSFSNSSSDPDNRFSEYASYSFQNTGPNAYHHPNARESYINIANNTGTLWYPAPGIIGPQRWELIQTSRFTDIASPLLGSIYYEVPNELSTGSYNRTFSSIYGGLGSSQHKDSMVMHWRFYAENLPDCTPPTLTIDGCVDPDNMAYWEYTGQDCAGTAIPASVIADPSTAIWSPGSCCPTCIHASADDITYSSQPLTLKVNGTDPTTYGGTDGYIDVTILDGGFDVTGTPQGLPTGTANYTFVVRNQDAADTMCGNTAGKGVGSGAVANNSFTFGYNVPSNSNGGLLQTGAPGIASYAASSAQGYVPGGSDLGTTNSEGFRAGTYDVYVFDSSSTVCLGQTTVTLADPPLTTGCGDSGALNYDANVGINFPSTCHFCEASNGHLVDGNDNFVDDVAVPNSGNGIIVTSPTNTTATDGSIAISFGASATFQTYINNIVNASSIQNVTYKIELYKWNTQTASGNSTFNSLTGFNAGTTQVGSTITNPTSAGWVETLDSSSLAGTFTYGYYTVKLYVVDPDATVEQAECYELIDVIVPVPACVDSGTATAADGVIVSDSNLYFHDSTLCNLTNNFCCNTPILGQTAASTTCNISYQVDVQCTNSPDFVTITLQYDNSGIWVDADTQALTSPSINIQVTYPQFIFENGYGTGNYRVVVLSQYSNSPDCTKYSNTAYIALGITGCTDPGAQNYDPTAQCDDGSCSFCVYGCTDPLAQNYNSNATCDNGSCVYAIAGCTDNTATNYDPLATVDDGSCQYLNCGCTDPLAYNYGYNVAGQLVGNPPPCDDNNCQYCDDPPLQVSFTGTPATCLDPATCTYNCDATIDLTVTSATGCATYTIVYMYFFCGISNSNVYFIQNQQYTTGTTTLTGLCPGHVWTLVLEDCNGCQQQLDIGLFGDPCGNCGCTDPGAINYDASAVTDDGSCEYCGCTDDGAINYNPGATANCDPDSCIHPPLLPPCIPPTIQQTYSQIETCIASTGFDYYKKTLSGQIDDCSVMNFWKLTLIDYLLKRTGLDCIYNCADVNTPDAADVYISCEELWITGGTTTGLNDANVNTLVPAVGTTSSVDMFASSSLIELYPGDVIKHHNSGNIWIFYGPAQGSTLQGTLIAGLDPENASGNASGYWGYCNDNMRYISNSNNINYIDNFINFVNKFCKDCNNNLSLPIPGASLNKLEINNQSETLDDINDDNFQNIEI